MTNQKLENCILIGALLPIAIGAYTLPTIMQYFIGEADRQLIANVEFAKQAIAIGICIMGSSTKGVRLFARGFIPLCILDITIAIAIAIAGSEHVTFRFYGDLVANSIAVAGIGQAINVYLFRCIPQERLAIFSNRLQTINAGGGIAGAGLSAIYCPFSVDDLLWINVGLTVACVAFRSFTFFTMKKMVENAE